MNVVSLQLQYSIPSVKTLHLANEFDTGYDEFNDDLNNKLFVKYDNFA